ncbi:MAG: glycosyltransferase family 2 protein, partial [Syntrophaceae bacterium]|nr:glycosyltransferase family 2 protein [Syntrophaceae bacterium]
MTSTTTTDLKETITIVIPAYNEEKTIGSVVRGVISHVPEANVLVVDDGSTDATAREAERSGAFVISHPLNKGNGACIKTALRHIRSGYIAVIDADGQHDPKDLPKLLNRLNEYDLVVGSRAFNSESGAHLRNLGNIILRRLASFLSERDITDLTSGFRAFKHDIACRFMHIYPNGYSFPSTSTLSFLMSGYNVDFIPIEAKKRPSDTQSKLRPFRDGFRFLMFILRIITLANPNRIFFPAGLIMVFLGLLITIRNLILFQQFSSGAVLFLAGGINTIFFGLILDQFAS